MNRKRLPKYVSEFADRHGKMRVRFRRKGQEDHYFQSVPWTPEFMQEYQAFLDRETAPAIQPGVNRSKPGTFNALIAAYYGSPEFKGLRPSSQTTYRGIIERFREQHGDKRVAMFERKHVKAIIGAMHETPAAANNLLDRLKGLMTLAIDIGMRKDDPTMRMRGYATRGDGFHTWTEDDIAAFEARHEIGAKPRLALALMLLHRAAAFRCRHHGPAACQRAPYQGAPAKDGCPAGNPDAPDLAGRHRRDPREDMTFLVTSFGKPFTPAGFGNWFRERCDEAGLPHCSAHGLRKAAARRLAEAGCRFRRRRPSITG